MCDTERPAALRELNMIPKIVQREFRSDASVEYSGTDAKAASLPAARFSETKAVPKGSLSPTSVQLTSTDKLPTKLGA